MVPTTGLALLRHVRFCLRALAPGSERAPAHRSRGAWGLAASEQGRKTDYIKKKTETNHFPIYTRRLDHRPVQSTRMELYADHRERAVIGLLQHLVPVEVRQMTHGDYAISQDGRVVATFERKTLADLAASIKDGRIQNHQKLLHLRAQESCDIYYIIEGDNCTPVDRKIGGLKFSALLSKLDSWMIRDKVFVLWTKDAEATASRLANLLRKYIRVDESSDAPNKGSEETQVQMQPEAAPDTEGVVEADAAESPAEPEVTAEPQMLETAETKEVTRHLFLQRVADKPLLSLQMDMLAKLPGVSFETVKLILSRWRFEDFLSLPIDVAVLAALQYDAGMCLGRNRAEKIANSLEEIRRRSEVGKEISAACLSCLQGVTVQNARSILAEHDLAQMIDGSLRKGAIAGLPHQSPATSKKRKKCSDANAAVASQKSRKIGPAIEKRILGFFTDSRDSPGL